MGISNVMSRPWVVTIEDKDDWHSYDAWLYFKHVSVEDLGEGYFDDWEKLQGASRTFYVGGLFDFDYVEGIARYSRQLVETHFVGNVDGDLDGLPRL